jgi:hypothetical protein
MSLDDEDAEDFLLAMFGEGLHTGLRKAADSQASATAWRAIADMDPYEWEAVLKFTIDGMRTSGIEFIVNPT